ncbi:MAG TPA: hypothetical protein VIJ86_10430 [Acidimicrobiales bacterium]
MAKSLSDVLKERPVDREKVDAHKKRIVEQVGSSRLGELRQASDI